MVLNVPYFKQERDYSCGPASLRMLLAFHAIVKTEEELRELAKTSFSGTCNDVLAETASRFRMCIVHSNFSLQGLFQCLSQNIPVLVNFINPTNEQGHFAVAVGYTETHVILNDPQNGKEYTIEHAEFERRWVSGDGAHKQWGMIVE